MVNFDFKNDYILEDGRVLLRPLSRSDFDNLKDFSILEPEIWKYSLISAAGEENMKSYLEKAVTGREDAKEYAFVVFDKQLKQYAGSTRFYDINILQSTIQLGYTWYGNKFQGTGLNKHCKFLLLEFAFEQLNMARVEFRADNENEKSKAAMLSIGFTIEGVLRSNTFKADGTRRDSIVLSILKNEWHERVGEMLRSKCGA